MKREGIPELIKYLETSDFFTSPASTNHHGAFEGGLCRHSLLVTQELYNLYNYTRDTSPANIPEIPLDSIILVGLLHDLCKVNTYKIEQKWRKDSQNKWESYDGYVRKPIMVMGHAAKSIFIIQQFIKLKVPEASAIFYHMGAYDTSTYNTWNEMSDCWRGNLLAFLLHQADMNVTYIQENPAY